MVRSESSNNYLEKTIATHDWLHCYTVITEYALQALLASHYVNSATCTSLFVHQKASPSADTKSGRAPINVDYVGELKTLQFC